MEVQTLIDTEVEGNEQKSQCEMQTEDTTFHSQLVHSVIDYKNILQIGLGTVVHSIHSLS